jgi:hypothetical protein
MKIVNSDSNNRNFGNDGSAYWQCGCCGAKDTIKRLKELNRVRFKTHPISPVFDELCVDCTHCGITSYYHTEFAYDFLKIYFGVINPSFVDILTIPDAIRKSKDYFEFIKVIS